MNYIKNILLTLLFVPISALSVSAQPAPVDSMTREQFVHSQTVKSDSLNNMALKLATPTATDAELNEAIGYIMKGLHTYAKFRDSTGLRETFDHLALVYHLQKKYVQAKWFYIQSNTLARQMKDTVNVIHSLIALSSVKSDIKDFALAETDLTEAISLAQTQPGIKAQIQVQQALATLYATEGNRSKAKLALNRISFLNDSVTRGVNSKNVANNKIGKQITVKKTAQGNNRIIIILSIILAMGLFGLLYFKRKRKSL